MTTWEFQISLNREPSDEEYDRLVEAGMGDCALVRGDSACLRCDREAATLIEAITSVLLQIRTVDGLWGTGVGRADGAAPGDTALDRTLALADQAVRLAGRARTQARRDLTGGPTTQNR